MNCVKAGIAFFTALAVPFSALALRSGDDAVELKKTEFISGGKVLLVPAGKKEQNLKVLVIFRAEGASSENVPRILQEMKRRYPAVSFVALTADPKELAGKYFADNPSNAFSAAIDTDGATVRKYMAGSMIYPAAFVIDGKGKIIWNGEVIDLPEMLEEYAGGTFDAKKAVKLAPLLDDLQSRMRSGEDRMADFAVRRILAIDPKNTAALRLRLFMLENSNRTTEAWNLVADRLKANPKTSKFYLMQIDLALRHSEFTPQLKALTAMYLRNIPSDPATDSTLVWLLLTRSGFEPEVLPPAAALVKRMLKSIPENAETLTAAEVWSSAALYAYRTGLPDKAILCQQKALDILKKQSRHRAEAAEKMLKYYKAAASSERI